MLLTMIPAAIRKYASAIPHPVAVIGCRTSGGGSSSLDCCEYDLAVFAPESQGNNHHQVLQVAGHTIELLYMAGPIKDCVVDMKGMAILKDSNRFALSSAASDITPEKYKRALSSAGKKSLISSLFCQQKMKDAKHPAVAAMWLKIAAYEFIGGTLALSGSRPMPLHELEQVRQAEAGSSVADGIQAALECIGIERATRPGISRTIKAVMELQSKEYDGDLVMSKIEHLLGRRMLADCYYYAGRVAAKNLARRSGAFHGKYAKLVQLAMDLTSDAQHVEKLQRRLFQAANGALKK